jgi:chitodextrinase
LTAVASDAAGNTTTATTVTVTVDNAAPTVSVTAPATGAFVSGNSVSVTGNASDNIGVTSVQFKLDGNNLGTADTTSPYSVAWDTTTATNGSHTITAVASDAAGNTTTSTSVSVTVDNAAPTVSITAPTNGATVSGTTPFSANSSDNSGGSGVNRVEFYVDNALVNTDTTSPYSFSWNTTGYSFGTHSLTAKAYDNVNPANQTTSTAVSVTVDNTDHTPPSQPGSFTVTGTGVTTISLSWTASTDNVAVTGYQLKRNGTVIATLSSSTLTYNDSGLTPSTTYNYAVSAFDASNNFSTEAAVSGTTRQLIPGDINQDGTVNITDLSILLSNWGSTTRSDCDLNGNGTVDIFDLSILLTNYGRVA